MGYRLNRFDEPVFMAGPEPMRTEFGIHPRLERCERQLLPVPMAEARKENVDVTVIVVCRSPESQS